MIAAPSLVKIKRVGEKLEDVKQRRGIIRMSEQKKSLQIL